MKTLQLAKINKLIKASEEKVTPSFSIPAGDFILFAVRDLNTKEVVAVSTILPLPSMVKQLALARCNHLEVVARGIKLFDTRWYLPNMEVAV